MRVTPTSLREVLLIEPDVYRDDRGFFLETFHAADYAEAGIDWPFVQDNLSRSHHGVLRGLHYQHPRVQGKLIQSLEGEVLDVAVDIRRGSATFGQWAGVRLRADDHHQLWIPPGFAHGFCVLSDAALLAYKCTDFHVPGDEHAIRWDDPRIGIEWPMTPAGISARDAAAPLLADLPPDRLPAFGDYTDAREQ